MNKNILIVAPCFPPSSLPPSQRVRLIVKHASKLGFNPIILTVASQYREDPDDDWLVQLAGSEYKKIEVRAINQRLTRKIGFGDLGLRWLPFILPAILKTARREKPVFILYPVPPSYTIAIAPIVGFITKIPYGIDFIDPWVDVTVNNRDGLKRRLSQKIALVFERWAVRHASVIYSVSEGINSAIAERYPESAAKRFYAIPYGVESDDFRLFPDISDKKNKVPIIRYIGAVWTDSYPVLEILLKAFAGIISEHPCQLEFYGSSYAPANLAEPQLNKWKTELGLEKSLSESPQRVSYKNVVKLTLEADYLLLFGGMQQFYASSKLMGLLASGKTFLAFLHRDSFPAKVLSMIKYPYLVLYSDKAGDLPEVHLQELISLIKNLLVNKYPVEKVDFINNPILAEHSAYAMSKKFLEAIQKIT